MIQPVKIKNLKIGQGKPKIIVPIVGRTEDEILESVNEIDLSKIDMIEWRVDFYDAVFEFDQLLKTMRKLRNALPETPILFTFRTKGEGGERDATDEVYANLNLTAAKSGLVDLIDVEIMTGDEIVNGLIDQIHQSGLKVIASNHDFHKTPSRDEMISRLQKMQTMGADLLKIAVMPNNKLDVLEVLYATCLMETQFANKPVITMAMGQLGTITRLSGEVFGSSMTFGSSGKSSAPGQIPINDLHGVLELIHRTQECTS